MFFFLENVRFVFCGYVVFSSTSFHAMSPLRLSKRFTSRGVRYCEVVFPLLSFSSRHVSIRPVTVRVAFRLDLPQVVQLGVSPGL